MYNSLPVGVCDHCHVEQEYDSLATIDGTTMCVDCYQTRCVVKRFIEEYTQAQWDIAEDEYCNMMESVTSRYEMQQFRMEGSLHPSRYMVLRDMVVDLVHHLNWKPEIMDSEDIGDMAEYNYGPPPTMDSDVPF